MKIQKKQEIEFFGTKTGNANSIALGYATETKNFGEVAVGVMNKSTAAKDPNSSKGVCVDPDATLFSVGCGGSGERKNALEVKGDGSVIIPGENGDINVADKIKQVLDTDASIELVKSTDSDLQYTLMVNNESRGSINIPKDQFLKNVTYDSEGKQLVFTFVTLDEDEHVERVPVGDLKDIYTAGEGITINGDNVISADFSSVMTAISDEKTQRETADNEIKSTLDTKADYDTILNKVKEITVCKDDKNNFVGNIDIDGSNTSITNGVNNVLIGNINALNGPNNNNNNVLIGYNNSSDYGSDANNSLTVGNNNLFCNNSICIGNDSDIIDSSICIGNNVVNKCKNSISIGHNLYTGSNAEHNIIIGDFNSDERVNAVDHFISIGYNALSYTRKADYSVIYQIAGYDYKNKEKSYNLEETLDIRSNHKKYIYGIGGYDGTNLVVTDEDYHTFFNPNVKSVQEVINEKADASAIPTKLSQLTNDANFITSYTETDPVWTREKTNYYTKTEIDNKGYLTQHQPLDNYVTKSTADANYLSLANGGDIKNEVTISKANATNDDYTLHLGNEGLYVGQDNGLNSIVSITPYNFTYRDFVFYVDDNQFSFNTCFGVRMNDENNGGKNTIQLGKVLITETSLSRLNLALDNITAASTAEEVVTKFNALLADLKNKGLMEADVTA